MQLLHTTDLHFNKKWFEWLYEQQDSYDVLCITGDFLEPQKMEPLEVQIEWISDKLAKFEKPLFVCSGNHDIELPEREKWLGEIESLYADGRIVQFGSVKIGCIPYIAPDFMEFGECDVILYHLPPAKTKTALNRKDGNDWGDKELYRVLKNGLFSPKILLCGHNHHPLSTTDTIRETTIYNPGSNKYSDTPNHIFLTL